MAFMRSVDHTLRANGRTAAREAEVVDKLIRVVWASLAFKVDGLGLGLARIVPYH